MKMDLKSPTSGLAPTSMWVNGKITKSTASASSTLKMEISTKEAGAKTRGMARELFGSAIAKTNSGDSIRGTGRTTRRKEGARCFSKMATDMMECGWTISLTAKAE